MSDSVTQSVTYRAVWGQLKIKLQIYLSQHLNKTNISRHLSNTDTSCFMFPQSNNHLTKGCLTQLMLSIKACMSGRAVKRQRKKQPTSLRVFDSWLGVGLCPRWYPALTLSWIFFNFLPFLKLVSKLAMMKHENILKYLEAFGEFALCSKLLTQRLNNASSCANLYLRCILISICTFKFPVKVRLRFQWILL